MDEYSFINLFCNSCRYIEMKILKGRASSFEDVLSAMTHLGASRDYEGTLLLTKFAIHELKKKGGCRSCINKLEGMLEGKVPR